MIQGLFLHSYKIVRFCAKICAVLKLKYWSTKTKSFGLKITPLRNEVWHETRVPYSYRVPVDHQDALSLRIKTYKLHKQSFVFNSLNNFYEIKIWNNNALAYSAPLWSPLNLFIHILCFICSLFFFTFILFINFPYGVQCSTYAVFDCDIWHDIIWLPSFRLTFLCTAFGTLYFAFYNLLLLRAFISCISILDVCLIHY